MGGRGIWASIPQVAGHEVLPDRLAERGKEVLPGLGRWLSNKGIADELRISPLTVKSHTRHIYRKLGVSSRRQAIARAIGLGLVGEVPPAPELFQAVDSPPG